MEHTPVEKHGDFWVKREDKYGSYPAPPLAKLRGARVAIRKLYESGVRDFATFDTRVSKSGQGVAAVLQDFPGTTLECFFPLLKGDVLHVTQKTSAALGAELIAMQGGRSAVLYAKAKERAEAEGRWMLPFGMKFEETVEEVCAEAREHSGTGYRTVVMSTGTTMMLSGVAKAWPEVETIYGVSCGMALARQWQQVERNLGGRPRNVQLVEGGFDYYEECRARMPFPSSVWYDRKAWLWLLRHKEELPRPVLFWNIGA